MSKTNSKEKKVLVLGASGQIGKEVLSQLNTKKCSITAVRRSQWEEPFLDNEISYQNLDLKRANLNDLENLILDQDVIFHLAGDTSLQVEKKIRNGIFFFLD
jgi:nucleoside-diphosphate-sugar epimerase